MKTLKEAFETTLPPGIQALIKRLFKYKPYLRKTLSQVGQDYWVINEVFNKKRNGYFVEIGSADGININNTYFLENRYGWSGICIEPNPHSFKQLKVNRKAICVNVCIDEEIKDIDFLCAGLLGGIVSEDTDIPKQHNLNDLQGKNIIELKAVPLAQVLDEYNAPAVIDYLSIDIEGAELRVLKNFPFNQYKFLCMTVERPGQELHQILSRNGYEVVKVNPGLDHFYIHSSFKDYTTNLMNFYRY